MSESVSSGAARRAQIIKSIQSETGIDEAMIERLVRRFYERVREDATLAPIFAAKIADWEPHLQRMCAFWSSVALMSGRYHGQPMQVHAPLPIDARHFDRWLQLFEETARELCPPQAALHFIQRARRIAQSLESGVAAARGVVLGKGARFMLGLPDVRQTRTVEPNNSNGSNSPLTVQSNAGPGNPSQPADRARRRNNAFCAPRQCQAVDESTGGVIQSRSSQA